MQITARQGICSPGVLLPLSLGVALAAGAGGLLVGGSLGWALLCAVVVPWFLGAGAGLVLVVVAVRRPQQQDVPVAPAPPPAPRNPVRTEQLVADLVWEIDLRDDAAGDLPRQQSRERGRGAP